MLVVSFAFCAQKNVGLTHPSSARAKGCLTSKRVPNALPMSYREIGTGLYFSIILHSDHPIKPINPITQTHHHSHNHNTLALSILARCYYFPSQISHFVSRFLNSKMNGSECSRGLYLCFRPWPTRWSGRIRYTLRRYTRSRLHWRACFLATQAPQPTRGPFSSCTKLPGDTTRLFALVAHAYCQWLAHNNFSPFRAIAILRADFANRTISAALFSFSWTQF